MKTARMTMGQALLAFLSNQYLEADGVEERFFGGVVGIFGHGVVVGLGEALAAGAKAGEGSLRFYQAKNEQGAAHIALGFAKQSNRRRAMAVTSSIGPGALNMVTAAGTATANRLPVLLLPGDAFACRQPDPVLQQLEQFNDCNVTANDAFKPVSKYWDRVSRPEQLMSAMINAMRVLTDPAETGAVTVALPQDVQGEVYDYPLEFLAKRVHHLDRRPPAEAALERVAELVAASKKPFVIVGGGVRYSGAEEEAAFFCGQFRIPLGETQGGKGAVDSSFPLNMSGIGVTGSSASNRLAKEADLVIAVGTRLGDFTTCSKWLFQNPDCKFVGINVGGFDALKLNATPLLADAKLALPALGSLLAARGYASAWGPELEREKKAWNAELATMRHASPDSPLSQAACLVELNESLLPEGAIVVSASGSIPSDMQRIWRAKSRDSYHVEYGFSCMGYEIAAALGARLAEPERPVVALVGDGAYAMLHSELLTAVQEGQKIIVVVLDNSGFQCIDNLQGSQGISHFGNEWKARTASGELAGPSLAVDFAKNAESWGALGLRARNAGEFRAAMKEALAARGPVVVDAKVEPKSMTKGYDSWWRVGTAAVSSNPGVEAAAKEVAANVARARKF
jgi:3D-(3,5/4)-trihydroxycyclohexane-1,2-dione acylhydrolase (decyclizing)